MGRFYFFRKLRTASDKKWHMHEKFVCTKYQLFGGASSAPAGGGQSCNFSKKAWNLTFGFDITVFISLFMASHNLVVGCTRNIPLQEQVRCLTFTAPALMVNMMNFYRISVVFE